MRRKLNISADNPDARFSRKIKRNLSRGGRLGHTDHTSFTLNDVVGLKEFRSMTGNGRRW